VALVQALIRKTSPRRITKASSSIGPPEMSGSRLLFVTTVYQTADSFLEETAQRAKERGYAVDLLTNMTGVNVREGAYDSVYKASWGRGFRAPLGTVRSFFQARRLLKSGSYSIVHTHTPTASAVTRAAAVTVPRKRRPKIVYTAHGFHFGEGLNEFPNKVAEIIERALLRWTAVLIVINEEDEKWAKSNSSARTRVVKTNGVGIKKRFFQIQRTDDNRTKAKMLLGIPQDHFVVLSIGELNANKQKELAMTATADMEGNRTLLVVGEGELRSQLEGRVEYLLERHSDLDIQLHGYQKDLVPYLLAADCLIHSSIREGQSLVILEAMAAGLPVVATPIRGNADSLRDGRGLLAQSQDPSALTLELRKVAVGGSEIAKIVEAARIFVTQFDRDNLAQATVDLYSSMRKEPI